MDPTTIFCPNLACPASGQSGKGNSRVHSRTEQRWRCTPCHKTFTAAPGTAFSRLRTPPATGTLVLTLLAHGWPLPAIGVACGCDERTVAAWGARAGHHGPAVQEHLVECPRDRGHGQAEEIRVKTQGGIVWLARAMMVQTRWWLAGALSAQRDLTLSRQLSARGRAGALRRPLLCWTEGRCSSIRAMRATCRAPVQAGGPGRPRWRPWRHVCIAPVVKRSAQRRVVAITRRLVEGTPARVETLRRRSHGDGVIHTASIEVRPVGRKEAKASG